MHNIYETPRFLMYGEQRGYNIIGIISVKG